MGSTRWIVPAFFLIVTGPAFAGPGVDGWVVSAEGGAPVALAGVALYRGNDETPLAVGQGQAQGSFSLQAPEAGDYRIVVGAQALQPTQYAIHLPEAGLHGMLVKLSTRPAVQISVLDADGKKAGQTQVWLMLRSAGHAPVQPFFLIPTGAPRALALQNAPWADYRWISSVEVVARTPGVGIADVRVPGWPSGLVTLRLRPGAQVNGKVVDAAGHPAVGARVCLTASLPGSHAPLPDRMFATTSATGRFEITALQPGHYLLSAGLNNAGQATKELNLPEGVTLALLTGDGVITHTPPAGPTAALAAPWRQER